ncbi:hypothetical protein [Cellulophaga baltica]|uniref:hypothetical protein n=1 Tax=Cellulophaga baltica TaxID=76594 RepID=UPI0003F94E88|nr:hypothetical protein [Cellulophaga baltica]
MKKYIILLFISLTLFSSCDEEEIVFDNINGQTSISFTESSYNLVVPQEGVTIEVPVQVTTISETARSYQVSVVDSLSTATDLSYSIGDVEIPANSYTGVLSLSFDSATLLDGVVSTLVVALTAPPEGSVYNEIATVEYFKEIVCNDVVVTVNSDTYGSETTWEITDAFDVVVASGGPYADVSGGETNVTDVYLEDGCYTFTIFDSYGDGQFDGTIYGNYTVKCSILSIVDGGGAFDASQSKEFCINQ